MISESGANIQQCSKYLNVHILSHNDMMTNIGEILCNCVPYPIHGVNGTTVYVSLCMVQGPITQYTSTVYIGIAMVYPH